MAQTLEAVAKIRKRIKTGFHWSSEAAAVVSRGWKPTEQHPQYNRARNWRHKRLRQFLAR